MAAVLLIGGIIAVLWVIILVNADPEDMRDFRGEDEDDDEHK